MQIASAQASASTYHQVFMKSVKHESSKLWTEARQPSTEKPDKPASDKLNLSPKALANQPTTKEISASDLDQEQLGPRDRLVSDIVSRMMQAMTGETPRFFSPKELVEKMDQVRQVANAAGSQMQAASAAPAREGYGFAYDSYAAYHEVEKLSYSAEGTIKTQDGQEFQFSVQLDMTRELFIEHREGVRLGDAAQKVDPLRVNFDGNAAQLGSTKFHFALDSDGRMDQIALLKPGSGLLALDKNGDGKEWFGPKSGNGFAELAGYDEGKNNFIDESDSIYNKLRIWSQDGQGAQQLVALGAKGTGAIYLGHLTTPFTFKGAANTTQGDVFATGLFFREDSSAGTIQHIDYAV